MGGSGGGFFSSNADPAELRRHVREAESEATDERFTASVNGVMADLLAQFNSRDVEASRRILDSLKTDLARHAELEVDVRLGGSVAKHTYVDGLSDVDALVVFDGSRVQESSPEALREEILRLLSARFGVRVVMEGTLAVTVTRDNLAVQLLPSLRDGGTLKIPSADGRNWAAIDPQAFAERLTQANRALDGKLVPCIKLAKSVVSSLPPQQRLTGYHMEALAIEVFRDYGGPRTPKAMLRHFFERAPDRLLTPIADLTGQSWHVDESLGPAGSVFRRIAADAFARIARRMGNADGAMSLDLWRAILEGE